MKNRTRTIIIILIIVAILALVGFIGWLMFKPQPEPVPVENPSEINVPTVLPQASAVQPQASGSSAEVNLSVSLKALAASFAERFGSYSNQGNFNNLDDLRSLMTLRMDAWTDNYISNQKLVAGQSYYGITTKAVATNLLELQEELGQAVVVVSTQRQETKGSTANPRVTYQNLKLELVETESGWKVDAATWQ